MFKENTNKLNKVSRNKIFHQINQGLLTLLHQQLLKAGKLSNKVLKIFIRLQLKKSMKWQLIHSLKKKLKNQKKLLKKVLKILKKGLNKWKKVLILKLIKKNNNQRLLINMENKKYPKAGKMLNKELKEHMTRQERKRLN